MQTPDPFNDISHAVADSGVFQSLRHVPQATNDGMVALEGEIFIEGHEVTLQLLLDSSFPLTLPYFRLRPWDALGFIPHVNPHGYVCFADSEGLVLDRERPARVIHEALQRVICVLTDGVSGRNHMDFVDEFEVYWSRLSGAQGAVSVFDPSDDVAPVIIAFNARDKEKLFWIAHNERDIAAFWNGKPVGETLTRQGGLYLPMEPDRFILPPRADGTFWDVEDVRRILLPGLSEVNQAKLRKLIRKGPRAREYVIVGLPRPSGGVTLFGLRYDGVGTRHPLQEGGTAERLIPLQIDRWDQAYLVQRGGGNKQLGEKRTLLVGCGAIGGHLAFELIRAGVLDLTLVDHDILTPENSYRHVLGRQYWSKQKAVAIKEEIEAQLPYSRITAITTQIEQAFADGSINPAKYDLVVLALGNPTVELNINEQIHACRDGPSALFTWLEPFGIGGHALLTHNGSSGGCLECLYTSLDDENTLANRAAFAAPGQFFGRAFTGCGSLHTPYGSVDAVQTAALAARLAIDALTGNESGNPLRSWKGNAAAFEAAGFYPSARYSFTADELARQHYAYQTVLCRICGN